MAERRMFAKTIIDSDAFLDMPLSTQALYFHLSMRADDDGFINNPKKIQRMIGCSDDDLKLLIAKRFIIPFENGIVVIKHWKIHNYIRGDRYKPTVYQEQLNRLAVKENKAYKLTDAHGIPNDNQETYQLDAQVRLGKVRLGKDSEDTIMLEVSETPYKEIADLYNSICISFNPVKKLTDKRKGSINARYRENNNDIEVFKIVFTKVQNSTFLRSGWNSGGKADFDWIIKPTNFVKVLEGKYDDKNRTYSANKNLSKLEEMYQKAKAEEEGN